MNILKNKFPLIVASFAISLSACTGGNVPSTGTNPGTGTDKASLSGKVTKEDGSPANNATVVLIKKVSGADSDFAIQRSTSDGRYAFSGVGAGNYRVAFVIQTEQERKDKTPIAYDPAGKSGEYFGAITTKAFDYDGDTTKTYQVPDFSVGWISGLSPNKTSFSANDSIKFSWSAVKGNNVKYNVFIKDSNDNAIYKSDDVTGTSFTWSVKKGNQGNFSGKDLGAGTYQYIVNAIFDASNAPDNTPVITYGNTANAMFTVIK